ncbi:MAG TPA: SDR family oxidoreductase [Chthoniobacterales bacterium]|nr:SDR family oxidoreductase [Chthoniobacterales bacterium]
MRISYFAQCTVLITGASAGIGREFARQLAQVAGSLILVARRQDRLKTLELELKLLNPELEIFVQQIDLQNEEEVNRFCDWLEESGLTVDVLINNAGVGDIGKFADADWQRIRAMLQVNMVALTYLTYRILPAMRKGGGGAILNVSSVAGFLPLPNWAVYAATKAYVTSFSEALRAELRPLNISVTALCPGPVPTEFQEVAARTSEQETISVNILTVPVQEVVRQALNAVSRHRARIVPGLMVQVAATAILFVPMFIKRLFFDLHFLRESEYVPPKTLDLETSQTGN